MPTDSLRQLEKLMVDLHRQFVQGLRESPEADRLRDEMEPLELQLGEDERRLFGELSEDLYEIEGERHVVPAPNGVDLESAVMAAFNAGSHRRVLELLRADTSPVSRDRRSYVQGRCWEQMGFPLTASLFFANAYLHSPRAVYQATELTALAQAGELEDLCRRVDAIEAQPDSSPIVLQQAAVVLFQMTRTRPKLERPALYRRVIGLAERGDGDPAPLGNQRVATLIAAGFSYGNLDDHVQARRLLDQAVATGEYPEAYAARGVARLREDRAGALADFRRAVELRSQSVLPYFHLAHDALQRGGFSQLLGLCQEARSVAPPGHWRGRMYEWEAIARAELNEPRVRVEALFSLAFSEAPLDPAIRENADRYASRQVTAKPWTVPPEEPPGFESLDGVSAQDPIAA